MTVGLSMALGGCRMGFDDQTAVAMGRDCGVVNQLGSLGALTMPSVKVMDETIMTGKIVQLSGTIDSELSVRVQLWDGYGAFAGGKAHAGSFVLEGADTSTATCGVCVYLNRRTGSQSSSTTTLIGVTGEVVIEALGAIGSDVAVALVGVELAEVDPSAEALIDDGCRSSIDDARLAGTSRSETDGVSRGGHGGDGAGSGSD
ncbi:MAG: hypothetical protein IPQ07_28625 [Myxococcales bacterium]|nr:hypothetical protein [Myxococcales bacterium]